MKSAYEKEMERSTKLSKELEAEKVKLNALRKKMEDAPKEKPIQIQEVDNVDTDKLDLIAYQLCNVDFIHRAKLVRDLQNFDQFGDRLNSQAEAKKGALLSDDEIRQLLLDIFYPKVDFIEYNKQNEFENIRLTDSVRALQDQILQSILALEHVIKLVEEDKSVN